MGALIALDMPNPWKISCQIIWLDTGYWLNKVQAWSFNVTSQNRYRTRSVAQTIFCPKFYECWRENTPSYDAILECTQKFFIGKHRYKVPCALQDGVIARKKILDVFLQPKHIVSLLVWYLFCGYIFIFIGYKVFKTIIDFIVCFL